MGVWASAGTRAIYLAVDLDVFNPGEAPGTGWPKPGGLTGQQLIDSEVCTKSELLGMG